MSYLNPVAYDKRHQERLDQAFPVSNTHTFVQQMKSEAAQLAAEHASFKVSYQGEKDFEAVANQFGLFADIKAHVPRGAYKGVVSIHITGTEAWLYLVPR